MLTRWLLRRCRGGTWWYHFVLIDIFNESRLSPRTAVELMESYTGKKYLPGLIWVSGYGHCLLLPLTKAMTATVIVCKFCLRK
jgi:hypothetical protein